MRKGQTGGTKRVPAALAIYPQAAELIRVSLDAAGHGADRDGPLFRPARQSWKVDTLRRHLEVQRAAGHADATTTELHDRRGYNPEKSASFFATY